MTVRELIEALGNFDPDVRVVVDGYEGGLDEPELRESSLLERKRGGSYWGRWDEGGRWLGAEKGEPVVVVGR